MEKGTTIRPECLRPASDFWIRPEADEVREVLRLAQLSGAKAAKLLGLGGAGSRTIRRYTGGEAHIPYTSWAILCEVAGLGRIWRDSGDGCKDGPPIEATPTNDNPQMQLFEQAEAIIGETWAGSREATISNIAECRDALVRMRQIAHAAGVSRMSDDALAGLHKRIAEAHDQLKVVLSWTELE